MKISEVTFQQASDYCGAGEDESEFIISAFMDSAKAFMAGYTGLSVEELDEHEDLVPAYLTLINEMHTNRDYTVEQAAENKFVKQALAMHSVNYL